VLESKVLMLTKDMPLNFPCSMASSEKKQAILGKVMWHCDQTKVLPGFTRGI